MIWTWKAGLGRTFTPEGKKHPNGRRIAASWCAHYPPEKLRESAEDAIDYMLAGDYDRAQLLVLACLDALGGAACTG